jgi:putative ABC transport system permease protein
MSTQTNTIGFPKTFSDRRLYEAASVEGVKSVSGVYMAFAVWKNPANRQTRNILLIGFNPADDIFNLPGIRNNLDKIKLEDVVLFDELSRTEFGPIPQLFRAGKKVTTEASSKKVTVGELFALGSSFAADGNTVTSDSNFLRIVPSRQKGAIDLGVIQLEPTANPELVAKALKEKLPNDINIFTKDKFIDYEKFYWQTSTSIGFIFSLGTMMGFIVGIVIVYQILYTDVDDHLPEYATLKAMGYRDWYFVGVVFQEAIILAFLGYLPGFGVAMFLYSLTAGATQLPIAMTLSRAIFVLILTVIMCIFSGVIAVRKLSAADPADIF